MAFVFALIVGAAIALLIYAIVDKIVDLFMTGWLGWLVSLVIGFAIVWVATDYYWPVLLKALGG